MKEHGSQAAELLIRRVAIVLSELRPGGMERVVVHLARSLTTQGVQPTVVCLQREGQLADDLTSQGISVVALESMRGYDLRAIVRLARTFHWLRPDVINVHDRSSLPYAVLANLLGSRRPLVFSAHGLMFDDGARAGLLCRLSALGVSAITAVSKEVADRHAGYFAWRDPIDIVPNGVPEVSRSAEVRKRLRKELGISEDAFVFLSVGNARPAKGFEYLLDAAALLRDSETQAELRCLVVGSVFEDPYGEMLRAKQKELDLGSSVHFLGFRDDVAPFYSVADAFVLPSRSEGLPMVILEAMTAALPIVATRVGGVPQVIGDGAGFLIDAEAPEQLSQAMLLLANDRTLCTRLGSSARARVREQYSLDRMTSRYLATFEMGGLKVHRPRFFYFPGILKSTDGWFYGRGIRTWVTKFCETWKPDLLDVHFVWPDGVGISHIARKLGVPYVITLRGWLNVCVKHTSMRKQCARALRHAAAVISVSKPMADIAADLGVQPHRIHVIPNGVDKNVFHPMDKSVCREQLGLPVDRRIIISVAHLKQTKGHDETVGALARLPEDVSLVIVGGETDHGRYLRHLKQIVDQLGLGDRLILAGRQPHDRVPLYLNAADVSVLASHNEGCPNVVLESLACGTPVVATRVGAVPQIITLGKNGAIVPVRDVVALAEGIRGLLDAPPSSEGLSTGIPSWDAVAERVFKVFTEVRSRVRTVGAGV